MVEEFARVLPKPASFIACHHQCVRVSRRKFHLGSVSMLRECDKDLPAPSLRRQHRTVFGSLASRRNDRQLTIVH